MPFLDSKEFRSHIHGKMKRQKSTINSILVYGQNRDCWVRCRPCRRSILVQGHHQGSHSGGDNRASFPEKGSWASTWARQYGMADSSDMSLGIWRLDLSSDTASMSCCSFISALILDSVTWVLKWVDDWSMGTEDCGEYILGIVSWIHMESMAGNHIQLHDTLVPRSGCSGLPKRCCCTSMSWFWSSSWHSEIVLCNSCFGSAFQLSWPRKLFVRNRCRRWLSMDDPRKTVK